MGGGGVIRHTLAENTMLRNLRWGNLWKREHLRDLLVVGWMIFKRVLRNMMGCRELDLYDAGKNDEFYCAR
jgi:hypothetical protein